MPKLLKVVYTFLLLIILVVIISCEKKDENEQPVVVKVEPTGLPQIAIDTENSTPITSKINYVNAKIVVEGGTTFPSFSGNGQIRGRGNTTWQYPKKPYRFKLDKESSILGLSTEKDWVLLANYLDGTHMLNAVAMKIGQLLEMPFTNHIIPVDVTLNGKYQGCYMLTEQIEVKTNRVNVGKDGVSLLLDTNYDDEWKFRSAKYNLPVMIKYPELTNQAQISSIKAQFEELESLVARSDFPNNNYLDYFDADAMANYFIAYLLTCNEEINHPKSTYLYKTQTGKFTMGPIWDFDWAFSYEESRIHFKNPNRPLFWNRSSIGTNFFSRIISDPKIKEKIKQKWAVFKENKFPEISIFIDDYSSKIAKARKKDYELWRQGNTDFPGDVTNLKQWFTNRSLYVNDYIKSL